MFLLLYEYFYTLFEPLDTISPFQDMSWNIGDSSIYLADYLTFISSIISLVIILVLCCLFIYRLIRVISRLFMGA